MPILGVDTGGTFTDFYLVTGTVDCQLPVLTYPLSNNNALP